MRKLTKGFFFLASLLVLSTFQWSCDKDTATPTFLMPVHQPGIPGNLYALVKAYHCANCHNPSGSKSLGITMDLTSAQSCYSSWVNVTSEVLDCSASATIRVAPGDAADSMVWQRLDGTLCAARMPYDGPPYMSQTEIDEFKNWINSGALPQ
jgi:hypothetical protein